MVALTVSPCNCVNLAFDILDNDLYLSHTLLKFRLTLRLGNSSVRMGLKLFLTTLVEEGRLFAVLSWGFVAADLVTWEVWWHINRAWLLQNPMLVLVTDHYMVRISSTLYLWIFPQRRAIRNINCSKRRPSMPSFVGMFLLNTWIFNLNCIFNILLILTVWCLLIFKLSIPVMVWLT